MRQERRIPIAGEQTRTLLTAMPEREPATKSVGKERKTKHMKQEKIQTIPAALNRADIAAGAATEHGATIGVTRNLAPAIQVDRTAMSAKHTQYQQAKLELKTRQTVLNQLILTVFLFVLSARDLLKTHLGIHHNSIWVELGFRDSMKVPRTFLGLKTILEAMLGYFGTNPTKQNTELNITSDNTLALRDDLDAAYLAVKSQKAVVNGLKRQCDTLFEKLKKRIRATFVELKELLDPMDERFIAYGFNKPGALSIPGVPANVIAVLIANSGVAIKWNVAARAERYRVYAKILGVDAEPVLVGTSEDLEFVVENLPANATVEIAVSAINNGGESARSAVVSVRTLA
jgi:hypothetical protein